MRQRIAACAAQEGVTNDINKWVNAVIWNVPDYSWVAAWDSAEVAKPGEDHGADPGVITDGMILAVIQPMVNPPVEE
jgi:hypothetical protein